MNNLKPFFAAIFCLVAGAAWAEQLGDFMTRYFNNSTSDSPSVTRSGMAIDQHMISLDWSGVDIPRAALNWTHAKLQEYRSAGKPAYLGSTQIPSALYQIGPPSRWVEFFGRELADPKKFSCVRNVLNTCSESRQAAQALDPLINKVAYHASIDKNLSGDDRQKLQNIFYSFYKDMSLQTNTLDWQLAPGAMLQHGAILGDPRAVQKALEMSEAYFKGQRGQSVAGNFHQAMFALDAYYSRNRGDLRSAEDPLNAQAVAALRQALNSNDVPEFIKRKLRDSLSSNGRQSPSDSRVDTTPTNR